MRMTERHARHDRVVHLRTRGWTLRNIAEEVGLSERQCARILEQRNPMSRTVGQPGQGTGRSKSTATELLDRVQQTMGDLASIARASYGPCVASVLRVEMMLCFAEQDITELRSRSKELGSVSPTDEEGSPPSQPDMS